MRPTNNGKPWNAFHKLHTHERAPEPFLSPLDTPSSKVRAIERRRVPEAVDDPLAFWRGFFWATAFSVGFWGTVAFLMS